MNDKVEFSVRSESERIGILNKSYSNSRITKKEYKFRLVSRALMVYLAAKKYLKKTSDLKILDFGSAEGKTLAIMDMLFANSNFVGIELSDELFYVNTDLSKNIKVYCQDVLKINPSMFKCKFSIVTALAFLEHIKRPQEAIDIAYKLLENNGLFIATCPEPIWDKIATTLRLLNDGQHEGELKKKRLKDMLQNAGFVLEKYDRFMWSPISFLPYLNLDLSPLSAIKIDNVIRQYKIFNWLFVNQIVVGRKR